MARWLLPLALPLAGLALLLARPQADAHWEHHPSHFWLVLITALVSLVLGYLAGEAARRLGDARLFLVSLAFMTSAGFLGLHALATPGVLLEGKNAGFVVATPVGLLIAGLFAAASAIDLSPSGRRRSCGGRRCSAAPSSRCWPPGRPTRSPTLPPLDRDLSVTEAHGPLYTLAGLGVPLYAYAAVRYLLLYRRRPAPMPLAVAVAFTLLAEAMTAIALGRNWHASWWEWHVLMACRIRDRRLRSAERVPPPPLDRGRFQGSLSRAHRGAVGQRYAGALSELVDSLERGEDAEAALATVRDAETS